ncbi:asparagine synthase [Bradyrhizobium jicamae]|uniref:asparagine synthase (glutamine-hydrolyzing) n=1 Tax=Bradyrhizobium jicamae TaxID=280332 RepID=A0A0R3KBQ9_9BRAD|nr:asparagine synthase (glutamine-hydrolyzing) [Bradyrhizobium jicamae]KRQ92935.1 asparagine synthase [Bradyrhizobium jicamae]
MCGICGVVNMRKDEPVSPAVLTRMNAPLEHRGPDDCGFHMDGFVGLGHRRLSVLDIENGRQPIANEDGSVWVTYNGEIYNYPELREDLARRGHRFRTRCDTEVIVHAYEEYGEGCVLHFNGMFAFALWDRRRDLLLMARDRLGIKPLYYATRGGQFVFASEIKAILAHPIINAVVDFNALAESLLCTTLLDSKTMFKDVHSVPPGSIVVVQEGLVRKHRYWSLERDSLRHGDSFDECRDRVRHLLNSAIRMEMVSDMPLGTLLSGGLDSSLVSALAAKHATGCLKTFSMDYDLNAKAHGHKSDPHYARMVARAYGTDHTEFFFRPDEYFDVLKDVTWHVEKPVELTSPSLYLLYRGVKPTATVVMSGEGADELFAGYYFFLDGEEPSTQFPWAPYVDKVCALLDPAFQRETACSDRIRSTLAQEMGALDTDDALNKRLYLFLKYYLVDMLERLDKTSMASGVESRVPFLDHRLVEYVVQMPSAFKSTAKSEKILLKHIAEDLLPLPVVARKKRPVPIPIDAATLVAERNRAERLVRSTNSKIGHYFDADKVSEFLRKRGPCAANDDLAVYRTAHALIALDAWHAAFGVAA